MLPCPNRITLSNLQAVISIGRTPGNKGADRKTVATYNVANPEMGGLVGNSINKHGAPYGLTEEFVEVYRLHSLLPETLRFRHLGDDGLRGREPYLVITWRVTCYRVF